MYQAPGTITEEIPVKSNRVDAAKADSQLYCTQLDPSRLDKLDSIPLDSTKPDST
jgi:hypothetical protein